jgi:hypothetical protein
MGLTKSILVTLAIAIFAFTALGDTPTSKEHLPPGMAKTDDLPEDSQVNELVGFLRGSKHFIVSEKNAPTFAKWLEGKPEEQGHAMGILALSTANDFVADIKTDLAGKSGKGFEALKEGMARREVWEAALKAGKDRPDPATNEFGKEFDRYFAPKLKKNKCLEKLLAEIREAKDKDTFIKTSEKLFAAGSECPFSREDIETYSNFFANVTQADNKPIEVSDSKGNATKREPHQLAGDATLALAKVQDDKYVVPYDKGNVYLGQVSKDKATEEEDLKHRSERALRAARVKIENKSRAEASLGNISDSVGSRDILIPPALKALKALKAPDKGYRKPGDYLYDGVTRCQECHNRTKSELREITFDTTGNKFLEKPGGAEITQNTHEYKTDDKKENGHDKINTEDDPDYADIASWAAKTTFKVKP